MLWADGLESQQIAHLGFLSVIGLGAGPQTIEPDDLHTVLDEWLQTTDLDDLSPLQRSICGCALLELFLASGSEPLRTTDQWLVHRVSPPLVCALENIAAGIPILSRADRRIVRTLIVTMLGQHAAVEADDDDANMLRIALELMLALDGDPSVDLAALERSVAELTRRADNNDRGRYRRIADSIAGWNDLPRAAQRVLRGRCRIL